MVYLLGWNCLSCQDSRVASLEKDLRDSKDELIRLRSINLSVSKDQIESLKKCETQLKDKVIILFIICCYPLFIA